MISKRGDKADQAAGCAMNPLSSTIADVWVEEACLAVRSAACTEAVDNVDAIL